MEKNQAFEKYTQVRNFIKTHCDEISSEKNWFENLIKGLPGLTMVGTWREWGEPNKEDDFPSFFDKCLDQYDARFTFWDSGKYCTVTIEGVYMNIWLQYEYLSVSCSFGFTDEDGYFNLYDYSEKSDSFIFLTNTYIDDHLHEKLAKLNIYNDGERWVLKRDGSELRYRSLDDLRKENGLDYQFDLEGITVAELQKHRYDYSTKMERIIVKLYGRNYILFRFTAFPGTPKEQEVTVAEHKLNALIEKRIDQNRYPEVQEVDEMYAYYLPKEVDINDEREIRESIESIMD